MKRKQIYLDQQTDRRLKLLAGQTGLSEAEHIRRAVDAYLEQQKSVDEEEDPILKFIEMVEAEGPTPGAPHDGAENHDFYLYGGDQPL